MKEEITEHQMINLLCGSCGTVTWGRPPEGVTAPVQYGPRAAALGVYLWHGQFLSRDRACQAMAEMFGCAPSPAALAAMTRKIAGIIAPSLEAVVKALVRASQVAHFDETGFRLPGSWPGSIRRPLGNSCWSPCTLSAAPRAWTPPGAVGVRRDR